MWVKDIQVWNQWKINRWPRLKSVLSLTLAKGMSQVRKIIAPMKKIVTLIYRLARD